MSTTPAPFWRAHRGLFLILAGLLVIGTWTSLDLTIWHHLPAYGWRWLGALSTGIGGGLLIMFGSFDVMDAHFERKSR